MLIKSKKQLNENGFVSIVVSLILMIVLSLIVLGFARLARREQRNALDRQLSTQAFYAAEAGANDTLASIKRGGAGDFTAASRTTCGTPPTYQIPANINPQVGSDPNIRYTCILYDTKPKELSYPNVRTDRVTVIPINNTNIAKFSFSWQGKTQNPTFRPNGSIGKLDQQSSWGSDTGMLRVMIIPREQIDSTSYLLETFNSFFYPEETATTGGIGSVPYLVPVSGVTNGGFFSSGEIVSGQCNNGNTPYRCNVDVTGLNYGSNGYILVLRSVYRDSAVQIRAFNSLGAVQAIDGAQVVIDVTGQAQDVLRRIQIRKPISSNFSELWPIGFTSAEAICKQIILQPSLSPRVKDDNGCSLP